MPTKAALDKKLTFEEFLDWCDEDTRAEWVAFGSTGRWNLMRTGGMRQRP